MKRDSYMYKNNVIPCESELNNMLQKVKRLSTVNLCRI